MSQCLRCSKPCETTSVFCEACRSHLRSQLWQTANTQPEAAIVVPSVLAIPPENREVSGDPLERITGPQPIVKAPQLPVTPQPSTIPSSVTNDVVEHAVHQLNEAAQRIAQVEQGNRRTPRASRLSPIRDISADIQRHSTPLPQVSSTPAREKDEDLGQRLPDLWPWFQPAEADDAEHDSWSNRTDPLMARHMPNSAEVARIEEEDLRRAIAEGLVTSPILPRRGVATRTRRRMHLAFATFAILAIVFLVVDSLLLSFVFTHPHHPVPVLNGPPSLTLSTNVATIGQTIKLQIRRFSSDSHVFLTHDIQEPVQLTNGSALVKLGTDGSADVTMLIDTNWGPGFHAIQAEGVSTRYTASATLQIAGAGPTRPSRLLIGTSSLDLGADIQGTSTIQTLALHNSGGGSITWAASSDQPWLLLAPPQGTFSSSQTISIAVERANLKPGDYKGTITFSSNVGANQWVQVHMTVRPLPSNVGAVLEVVPPLLSFTALDGGANPASQAIMVSNPGSQPLYWSLSGNNPVNVSGPNLMLHGADLKTNWLNVDQTAGVVVPHGTSVIHALVNSRTLLPGVYTNVLMFAGSHGVYDGSQSVSVSLTIQPRCGLTLNTGIMSFIAVSGQTNPSNQSLGLSATSSCTGVINWKAIAANSWLTIAPAAGQLKGSASTVTSVGVNASILKPGTYTSYISFLAAQSTQTVTVQLVVQAPPPPSAPILGATPLNLNFSTTQGMPNPPAQVVTITNTGASQLNWRTSVNLQSSSWLGAGPTGGSIPAGQTGQVTVYINTADLTPNTYVGQVILIGTDVKGQPASGSPQTIAVNLLVLPPCTLQQPSLSSVAFTATQGSNNPDPQSVVITASGNCAWPLNWRANAKGSPSWLQFSPTSGSLAASGQSATLTVGVNIANLNVTTYTTHVTISASDGSNTPVQGSPQIFTVTLTILPPCSLQMSTNSLNFTIGQGQPAPSPQSFSFNESGTCARPVSWSATGDSGSSAWLVLKPPTSGSDSGTVSVGVNSQSLSIGTYQGTITLTATGNGGAIVQGSPQTVTVTLTVTGYALSGSVTACSDNMCTTSKPLPGASLTLVNNTTNQTVTTVADSLSNFSFSNLPLGSYTLTASGTDGTYNYYGTATLNITGNQSNFIIDVYPK